MHCSSTVYTFKNIKNRSYGTIHTFKNYFVTMFLVFNFSIFSFNKHKFNPNLFLHLFLDWIYFCTKIWIITSILYVTLKFVAWYVDILIFFPRFTKWLFISQLRHKLCLYCAILRGGVTSPTHPTNLQQPLGNDQMVF